jgi:hypothetical protein
MRQWLRKEVRQKKLHCKEPVLHWPPVATVVVVGGLVTVTVTLKEKWMFCSVPTSQNVGDASKRVSRGCTHVGWEWGGAPLGRALATARMANANSMKRAALVPANIAFDWEKVRRSRECSRTRGFLFDCKPRTHRPAFIPGWVPVLKRLPQPRIYSLLAIDSSSPARRNMCSIQCSRNAEGLKTYWCVPYVRATSLKDVRSVTYLVRWQLDGQDIIQVPSLGTDRRMRT